MIPVIAENRITGDYGEGGSVLADHETFGKIIISSGRSQGGCDREVIARIPHNPILPDYAL